MTYPACRTCGGPLSEKIPWCPVCGAEKGFVADEPKPKPWKYLLTLAMVSIGWQFSFGNPHRDSLLGLAGFVLFFGAIGIVVNDFYRREISK
jgi:hypothetical protein